MGRSLKSQMKYADKLGAKNTLIIGSGELESGKANLRNMENGEQREISFATAEELAKELGAL